MLPPSSWEEGQVPAAPAYSGSRARPGRLTAGAVVLIVLGSLASLGGALFLIGAAVAKDSDQLRELNLERRATIALVVIGLFILAFGIAQIVTGAKVLGLARRSRVVGIVLASIGAALWVLTALNALVGDRTRFDPDTNSFIRSDSPEVGGLVLALLFLCGYVYVIVELARHGKVFRDAAGPQFTI